MPLLIFVYVFSIKKKSEIDYCTWFSFRWAFESPGSADFKTVFVFFWEVFLEKSDFKVWKISLSNIDLWRIKRRIKRTLNVNIEEFSIKLKWQNRNLKNRKLRNIYIQKMKNNSIFKFSVPMRVFWYVTRLY